MEGSKRAASTAALVLSAVALALLTGALRRHRSTVAAAGGRPGIVRVALLADTHLAGPELPLNTETGPLDNGSITRTQQRLWRAVWAINRMAPSPDLVLFGGDVVHNGLERLRELGLDAGGLKKLAGEPVNGYKIAQAILSELQAPQLFVWGNHDNLAACGAPEQSPSRQLVADVYKTFFKAKPYDSRIVGDWKIVALNSMLGYTWNPSDPRCQTVLSSFGEEQLRWLGGQLAEGKHTLIMAHFPLTTSVLEEVDTSRPWRDLRSVLLAHSNVRLVLSGHFHKGISWEGLFPFPALTLPATRYSPQNFFALDLFPDGSFSLVDDAKNRGGGRCSDWWTYEGEARRRGDVEPWDAGDCGIPAAGQEAGFALQPVLNASSIPPLEAFNPERSCQSVLARPFLDACADGPADDCCDVLAVAFRPSSTAPFSTCLCQPAFWQEAAGYLAGEHGQDLAAVADGCRRQHGKLVLARGGPQSWCPAAAEAARTGDSR